MRVVDGDTILARIDLGWHVQLTSAIRIDGMNAPEHGTNEGDAATAYLRALLPADREIEVTSHGLLGSFEKYGRVLGTVTFQLPAAERKIASDVATAMIAAGHAKPWDGRGTRPT